MVSPDEVIAMKTILTLLAVSIGAFGQSAPSLEAFYSSRGETYTVKAGETLFHIAERLLGDPYKAAALAKLNGIKDPLQLKEGQKIQLPQSRQGILYSFQKLEEDCNVIEVNESYKFRNGDRFQLRLAANFEGYLYLYNQTAAGRLEQIYPGAAAKGKQIQPLREYMVPREDWFRFDSSTGPEELLVLISLKPLDELDRDLVAGDAARARIKSYFDGASEKGIVVDSQGGGAGRSLILTSPIEGTKVFAHRILLKK